MNLKLPAAVGTPEITPVAPFMVKPGGRSPPASVHAYGV